MKIGTDAGLKLKEEAPHLVDALIADLTDEEKAGSTGLTAPVSQ